MGDYFFTSSRLALLRQKAHPVVILFAEDDKNRMYREDLESRLGDLPEPARENLIARLESYSHDIYIFLGFYHEVVAGSLLARNGFAVEYETQTPDGTPDWLASRADTGKFIMEVYGRSVTDKRKRQDQWTRELRHSLEELPFRVVLVVRYLDRSNLPSSDPPSPLQVVRKVDEWLQTNPGEGDAMEDVPSNLRVELRRRDVTQALVVVGPTEGFWVDEDGLAKKLRSKTKKYRRSALEDKMPIVLAVLLDFATGLSLESLSSVLADGDESIFRKYPELSGCLHLKFDGRGWCSTYLANTFAQAPLNLALNT